jgi:hypothetical protein
MTEPQADSPAPETLSSANTAAMRRRGRSLFKFGLAGAIVIMAYYAKIAKVQDPVHLFLGEAIIALALLPALRWAQRAKFSLPLFEMFMFTNMPTFAIPLLSGQRELQAYDSDTITTAALAVILYQIVANLTYFNLPARPKKGKFWRQEIISRDASKFLGYGMIVTTIYTIVFQFTNWIPYDISGIVRAACYGVGIIATFLQARRWGENDLPYYDKIAFGFQLAIQIVLSWVSLTLVQGITIGVIALLGYISGSKRIPVVVLAVALPITAVLHNGKSAMRAKYWEAGGDNVSATLADVPAFYSEWIGYGLNPPVTEESTKGIALLQRTSLFHMLCRVISISPGRLPFVNGVTYLNIPAQFVPRFFWPDKPPVHAATSFLSVYYGLQSQEDTAHTTIGFGAVTEAYANFGFFGMAGIAFFFAAFFKKISEWSSQSPMLSYPGIFMVILMAWSFQTELPLADWIGSLYQATVVGLGIPLLWRNFLA